MRRPLAALAIATITSAALVPSGAGAGPPADERRDSGFFNAAQIEDIGAYVPGEVLVRYEPELQAGTHADVRATAGASLEESIPVPRTELLDLPSGTSVPEAIAELEDDPRVEFVEPNYRVTPTIDDSTDGQFDQLWGFQNTGQLHNITDDPITTVKGIADSDADVEEAWDVEQGDEDTVIAILDTGVDVTHPDIADNLWVNPGESGGGKETNGQDDDGNGYIDDVHGWDTAGNDKTLLEAAPVVGRDHGTHVAGTIAGVANNGGIVGVCPGCKIMVLKFMRPATGGMSGSTSDEVEALNYAREMGADIVNGSYGNFNFSLTEREGIEALRASDVLGVFAASNRSVDNDLRIGSFAFGLNSPAYPASFGLPGIMSVAASQHADRYGYWTGCVQDFGETRNSCAFTSFGQQSVDVAAPGVDIVSSIPGNSYDYYNGTSMAAPFTAGIAGLVKSKYPDRGPIAIKNAIMRGAERRANLDQIYSSVMLQGNGGWPGRWVRSDGRVNALNALSASTESLPTTDGNIRGARRLGRSKKNSVKWGGDTSDVYKKTLVKGVQYRVTLDGPNVNTEGFSVNLLAYLPSALEIWHPTEAFCNNSCDDDSNDAHMKFTANQNGRFYFQVYSWLSQKYKYRLTIKKVEN